MSATDDALVALRSRTGAALIASTVLASAVGTLDANVVKVAVPTIGRDLHAGLGALLDEGLAESWKRHGEVGARLHEGLEKLGFTLVVDEPHRLPGLTTAWLPAGVDDVALRRTLLDEYSIEVGGGLGPFAGKAWRIGLMGHGARHRNVTLLLAALAELLGR